MINYVQTTLNDYLKDNSHYFIPTKAKVCNIIQFCDYIGIYYFKKDIFYISNVDNCDR